MPSKVETLCMHVHMQVDFHFSSLQRYELCIQNEKHFFPIRQNRNDWKTYL